MRSSKSATIVLKLGTSSIVDEVNHEPLLSNLSLIVETAVKLRKDGHKVVIVSSGAIGVALGIMGLEKRPKHLPRVQALAAIGQCKLMSLWDNLFGLLGQPIAQILLTRNDIADRVQYLNAKNTFSELLEMGVIPIVNENDTIAVSEIKFGDNDTLSAITAAMVHADYLFLMTDVDCLYTSNPRTDTSASPIRIVANIKNLDVDVNSPGSTVGTGGMLTKITAARLAVSAGVMTIITRASRPGNIMNIFNHMQTYMPLYTHYQSSAEGFTSGKLQSELQHTPLHTSFIPSHPPIRDRYFWILHGLSAHGIVYIDDGAKKALINKNGLLPVGVIDVEGSFSQQEAVQLVVVNRLSSEASNATGGKLWDGTPIEVGRALVNYSSTEIARIKGIQSTEIANVLGYADTEYVALRENISFFSDDSRPSTPSQNSLDMPRRSRVD